MVFTEVKELVVDEFIAWAVDSRSDEGHGLLGRYWLFKNSHRNIPPHLEGCMTALFKTRKLAREGASSVRGDGSKYSSFPKARAVKIKVTIKELTND